MAPRRNDAPPTLPTLATFWTLPMRPSSAQVKVAERDCVAMQALLPFIRDLDYTVRQTRPTESWITEARNMALNAVLVAFPRSRNTTASRRPGLDTTWLLMTRRLRGAWDPSRAFPITLPSPPPTTPKPGTVHPPPRPVFSARSASPVAGHLICFGLRHQQDQCSVVQFKSSLRVVELPTVELTCSVVQTLQCSTFSPSPTPPPTDAGAQEAFASLSQYRMDQLAENPLQFMQDWAALTAPSSEQRDPRLQRAIDAYGVLELRERLAREAENAAIMLPLAETVASSVASSSSSSSSSSDSEIHFYRPLPRGYIPSYRQRPDEDEKAYYERLAHTQF
ncbi:hypothetical protein VKT23_008716 [Stygiomarasmius scandens]|uniref:Uncharacterized protein n=1 Tax=Marasmiellus scandens TaxID=2682957 RepID=A0ABR1JI57_9AGAR